LEHRIAADTALRDNSSDVADRLEKVPLPPIKLAPLSGKGKGLHTGRNLSNPKLVEEFVARGGQVVFFPPEAADAASFAGVSWGDWTAHPQPLKPEQWRSDEDILSNTLAGGALSVGDLEVRRSCGLAGEIVPLAALADGLPLVARVADGRGIYFCATLPRPRDSSLAGEGIVLYAVLQRLIERGLEPLAGARQIDAGPTAASLLAESGGAAAGPRWERLAGAADAVSTEAGRQAGVFAAAGRLVAVNRPAAEDTAGIVAAERIDSLFRGLSFNRITGTAGRTDSLVQEIWRAFLIAMLLALVAEGLLSLPRRRPAGPSQRPDRPPSPPDPSKPPRSRRPRRDRRAAAGVGSAMCRDPDMRSPDRHSDRRSRSLISATFAYWPRRRRTTARPRSACPRDRSPSGPALRRPA
jgi:hypothetical protein